MAHVVETQAEEDFLAAGKDLVAALAQGVQEAGAPPLGAAWGIGLRAYEDQFTPIFDEMAALMDNARRVLKGDTLLELSRAVSALNLTIERFRHDTSAATYALLRDAFVYGPLAIFFSKEVRRSAGMAASDLGRAAKEVYGPGGDYDVMGWLSTGGALLKWLTIGGALLLGLQAVGTVSSVAAAASASKVARNPRRRRRG